MAKREPLDYEKCECRNPECGLQFTRLKGSPVSLCVSCLIHPNLIETHAVRDPKEQADRHDF